METINLTINRRLYTVETEERATLLFVIREVLHLNGTKYGCGTNDCGACKVLIDGEAVNSCCLLAKNVQDRSITTIEGLSDGEHLHPVQQAFIECGAVQCGFCTPGMIITAAALLSKNPDPTREEIIDALDNNLCRCTGYKKIIEAIERAAVLMREEEVPA